MEIQQYVSQKERHLTKGSRRIRDFRVFDFNFIPEKPLMREEVKPVVDALLRYEKTGIANHLLIFGSTGSGKTLLVKYLMQLFSRRNNIIFKYANCRIHNTSFKILAFLLGVKPRGSALNELWQRFCKEHPGKVVLILDEIDLLSDKDRNKDILYLLSRPSENYMSLLLSNNPKSLRFLDESIRSALEPEVIHFRNYTAPQIQKILEETAKVGLRRFSHTAVGEIAALTAKNTNSDVRVAIKTLYYTAFEPETSVEENFERAMKDIFVDVLNNLTL